MLFVDKPCDYIRHLYSYGHGNPFVVFIGPDRTSEVLHSTIVGLYAIWMGTDKLADMYSSCAF